MAKYKMNITESVERTLYVEAETMGEAYVCVQEKFDNGEIILDKENDYYDLSIYGGIVGE